MKIGISSGGTFNPVHIAHLRIAEEVRDSFDLDEGDLRPGGDPSPQAAGGRSPFATRFEMVRLAIAGNPLFAVSDIEGKRGGKSYSIDTIHALRQEYPDDEFFFIIGSDSFLDIGTWRKYAAIFALCNIVVVERPGAVVRSICSSLPLRYPP